MIKLDVCLEAVLTDLPPIERIPRIAAAGFRNIEFWFHDATFDGASMATRWPKEPRAFAEACRAHGIGISNMVVNSPDGSFGGALVCAADRKRYLERLEEVIEYAAAIGCKRAITCSGNVQPGVGRPAMRACLEEALGQAAAIAARGDFTLLLEPLNTLVDHAGYYLDSSNEGAEIVRAIGSPNLRLVYDVYHMQVMEGNVLANVERNLNEIGHFHSAGVPGRGEHDAGELHYPNILRRLNELGYAGYFGLEYFPRIKDHEASLKRVYAHINASGVAE